MRTRPAFGRCDCARSDRGWEVAGGYTSEASHVRRTPTPDGGSLLGDVSQLCHGFFHLSPTPELASHPHELCLRLGGDKCETKGVVVVAALRDRAGDVKFLARYSNCPLSSHAEEYAIRDEELIRAVKDLAPDAAPITLPDCGVCRDLPLRDLQRLQREQAAEARDRVCARSKRRPVISDPL